MRWRDLCLFSTAVTIAASAQAQTAIPMPPPAIELDSNRMNLVSLDREIGKLGANIGNEQSGLSSEEYASGSALSNNFSGYLQVKFQIVGGGGGPIIWTAGVGKLRNFVGGTATGTPERHRIFPTAGPYTEEGDGGTTLSCTGNYADLYSGGVCTLWEEDGSAIEFPMWSTMFNVVVNGEGQIYTGIMFPSKITRPDGEVLTFQPSNNFWSITSSLGFGLRNGLSYYSTLPAQITLGNMSYDYCGTTTTCTLSTGSQKSERLVDQAWVRTIYRNGQLLLSISANGIGWTYPSGRTENLSFAGQVRNFSRGTALTSYSPSATPNQTPPVPFTATVTNPDQTTWSYQTDGKGHVSSITDELGRQKTYLWYSTSIFGGLPRLIQHCPIGSTPANGRGCTSYTYTHGALSKISTLALDGAATLITNIGIQATCNSNNYRTCNKPTYVIDPRGKRTDYQYSTVHGGILKETFPADAAGVRPERRYEYLQLYPKVKNAGGALVNSTPVWRLTKISECISATAANPASCVGTTNERVTTYAYNDNNLFRTSETVGLGDGSQSKTTSYQYNYAGDVTVIDGPRTDVDDRQYFTFDALRRKVFEISADPDGAGSLPRLITRHVYDVDGRELRTESGTGFATDGSDFVVMSLTRNTYDPTMGNLTKKELVQP